MKTQATAEPRPSGLITIRKELSPKRLEELLSSAPAKNYAELTEFVDVRLEDALPDYGKMSMDGIVKELCSVENLDGVYLGGMGIGGYIPSEIGDLQNLTMLDLSGNDLSGYIPSEIGNLRYLRMLDLSGNDLRGRIPYEIRELKLLEELYLQENDLDGLQAGADKILTLPYLRIINVNGERFKNGYGDARDFGPRIPPE